PTSLRASAGSSFAIAASSRSRSAVGSRSWRRSQRSSETVVGVVVTDASPTGRVEAFGHGIGRPTRPLRQAGEGPGKLWLEAPGGKLRDDVARIGRGATF